VTAGIDLGTSSTKVCFRRSDETRPTPYVCLFEENPGGYPPIALPSAVRVVRGKVYFAAEAERRSGGMIFRSFKTCLRCKLVNRYCLHCGTVPRGPAPGYRALPDGEGVVAADELATWYLAHVIAQIDMQVRAQPGHDGELSYNLAAPMDVIQKAKGRERYTRTLFLAEKLARTGVAEQGAELQSLRWHYNWLRSENPELPPESERSTFVVDENCAGLVAFSNARTAQSGRYALIDVGAGTTDMSIFHYEVQARHLAFYSADVCPIGADRVDQLVLADALNAKAGGRVPTWLGEEGDALGRIRIAKQGEHGSGGQCIPVGVYEKPSALVGAELFKHYKIVWEHAYYEKDRDVRNWRQMKMFLIGGGSNLPGLPGILTGSPWQSFVPEPQVLQLPSGIRATGNDPTGDAITRHERLLMVAYGLSFPYADLAERTPPADVIPKQRPEPVPVHIEDTEKFGHWW
jgi:hypothetical protein